MPAIDLKWLGKRDVELIGSRFVNEAGIAFWNEGMVLKGTGSEFGPFIETNMDACNNGDAAGSAPPTINNKPLNRTGHLEIVRDFLILREWAGEDAAFAEREG